MDEPGRAMLEFEAARRKACSLGYKMARRKGKITMNTQADTPTFIEVRNLAHAGFSGDEIAGLLRVKGLFQRGAYHEVTPEYRRLDFARWLYRRGRLQS